MKRLRIILSRVLEINQEDVHDDLSPKTIETWDSFNGLMLVSDLEQEFNVKFSAEEIVAVTCVRDIREALGRHGVELTDE